MQALHEPSFIYGMVTAFCECVAAGCKPMALSPPMRDAAFAAAGGMAIQLIEAHGLSAYHEENLDLPPALRVHWLVIYAEARVIDAYRQRRAAGKSPARGLDDFADLLGYRGTGIHTGYDAYRTLFADDCGSDRPGNR